MYGAILGDIIGSPYEFDRGGKTKEFALFSRESSFMDISEASSMERWELATETGICSTVRSDAVCVAPPLPQERNGAKIVRYQKMGLFYGYHRRDMSH